MTLALDKYVGRNIRLTERAFSDVAGGGTDDGVAFENCFVVAQVDRRLHKLVCYGHNRRIVVATDEVILI